VLRDVEPNGICYFHRVPTPEAFTPPTEYDANGVDRTLIRQTLAMTPEERVRTHDALLADVERLRAAGKAARDGRP
jgi:hypothetical protein